RALVLATSLMSVSITPWFGLVLKATGQSRKTSLGNFSSPADWRVENLTISVDGRSVNKNNQSAQSVMEGADLGLSIPAKSPTFGFEITNFFAERNLGLSSDAVRISSD